MSPESQLRDKLRKIEALFAGAGTAGERLAAEVALGRVKARLAELGRRDPAIETQFSMSDQSRFYVVCEVPARFSNDFNAALNQPTLFPALFEGFKRHAVQDAVNALDGFNNIRETW
jgi:hypothetical protein